ncbi:MAG: hypothetical protein LUC45_06585 [Paraprevotella sp.]|nr:hypothetical protein [Paraprevotella sp.]
MKQSKILCVLLVSALGLTACDDGPIKRTTVVSTHSGYTAKLTGHITGVHSCPEYYQVVLAGFGDNEYAATQVLVTPDSDNNVSVDLTDIGSEVKTIELCVTNTLRKRIVSYQTIDATAVEGDTIYMDVGQIDVGMYTAIQENVFNKTCVQCHGGAGASGTASAGLYLVEGKSYDNLVNHPSTQVEGGIRVIPGDADSSIIHKVINPGNVLGLGFSHENLISSSATLKMIDEWINAGAKK